MTDTPRHESDNLDDAIARAADLLRDARRLTVMTGAGVSAESEIPTYRDAMEGLWKQFDPQTLATPEAFQRDPAMVTEWYDFRRQKCAEAIPNPGHQALARLEREMESRRGTLTLLTQNVDGLHQRAGSRRVVELHGSIITWRCTRTGEEFSDMPMPLPEYPMPTEAGGYLRPGVVWFGEMLPPDAIEAADEAARDCDVFMSVGTSAQVYPAAGFLVVARDAGARTIEVNPDATAATDIVDLALPGKSGRVLPRLVGDAFGPEAASPPADSP